MVDIEIFSRILKPSVLLVLKESKGKLIEKPKSMSYKVFGTVIDELSSLIENERSYPFQDQKSKFHFNFRGLEYRDLINKISADNSLSPYVEVLSSFNSLRVMIIKALVFLYEFKLNLEGGNESTIKTTNDNILKYAHKNYSLNNMRYQDWIDFLLGEKRIKIGKTKEKVKCVNFLKRVEVPNSNYPISNIEYDFEKAALDFIKLIYYEVEKTKFIDEYYSRRHNFSGDIYKEFIEFVEKCKSYSRIENAFICESTGAKIANYLIDSSKDLFFPFHLSTLISVAEKILNLNKLPKSDFELLVIRGNAIIVIKPFKDGAIGVHFRLKLDNAVPNVFFRDGITGAKLIPLNENFDEKQYQLVSIDPLNLIFNEIKIESEINAVEHWLIVEEMNLANDLLNLAVFNTNISPASIGIFLKETGYQNNNIVVIAPQNKRSIIIMDLPLICSTSNKRFILTEFLEKFKLTEILEKEGLRIHIKFASRNKIELKILDNIRSEIISLREKVETIFDKYYAPDSSPP